MPIKAQDFDDNRYIRLSDRILFALEMALEQEDIEISKALVRVLEMAMTRNTGGGQFVERRDYPPSMETALDKLDTLEKGKKK